MLAKVYAPARVGIEGSLIEVECDIGNGLPGFVVVGLADKAVDEAKDRVRSALKNSRLLMPPKRITVNLAPADLPKDGTGFDLSIAIAILAASEQVGHQSIKQSLFVGEVALDGSLRPVKSIISYIQLAKRIGLKQVFLPATNAKEASLIDDITLFPAESLHQVYRHLVDEQPIIPYRRQPITPESSIAACDMADIYGQAEAKRAIEIAAAGGHNLLLSGPPGSGKTMLSKSLLGILPPLTLDEMIEITQLHSLAGQTAQGVITKRPFRNPHHTASNIALIGGGKNPKPGEISLSHHGVLFLDELPEFPRSVLEVLRQPLEDGQVTIARATGSVTFPAKFMLVATQNPCPCGYAGDSRHECSCSPASIANYKRKISGPLMDRIDLVVNVSQIDTNTLSKRAKSECSQDVANRVATTRSRQYARLLGTGASTNAQMDNRMIDTYCKLTPEAEALGRQAITSLNLSARNYLRTLKVALTIADLANSISIEAGHLAEALQYRPTRS